MVRTKKRAISKFHTFIRSRATHMGHIIQCRVTEVTTKVRLGWASGKQSHPAGRRREVQYIKLGLKVKYENWEAPKIAVKGGYIYYVVYNIRMFARFLAKQHGREPDETKSHDLQTHTKPVHEW